MVVCLWGVFLKTGLVCWDQFVKVVVGCYPSKDIFNLTSQPRCFFSVPAFLLGCSRCSTSGLLSMMNVCLLLNLPPWRPPWTPSLEGGEMFPHLFHTFSNSSFSSIISTSSRCNSSLLSFSPSLLSLSDQWCSIVSLRVKLPLPFNTDSGVVIAALMSPPVVLCLAFESPSSSMDCLGSFVTPPVVDRKYFL